MSLSDVVALWGTIDRELWLVTAPLTFKRVLQLCPAAQLAELKESVARDGLVDAEAIRAWRDRTITGRA